MIKIYGSDNCIDCRQAKVCLEGKDIVFEYIDIDKNIVNLKEFIGLRDSLVLFDEAKKEGYVGIPLFYVNGQYSLDLDEALHLESEDNG